jgi:hypothetical protein
LAAFQIYAESALRDDVLSAEEDKVLFELRETLGLGYQDLYDAGLGLLVDRVEIARINGGRLYTTMSDLAVDDGEYVIWEAPAQLLRPRRRRVGRSTGFSYRVAPGVRFHTGWFESEPVVDRQMVEDDVGLFTVTTERAVFRGSSRTITIDFGKLVGMNLFIDGIQFHVSNRERVDLFRMTSAPVAAACINAVANADAATKAAIAERLSGPLM